MTLTYKRLIALLQASLTDNQIDKRLFEEMTASDWVALMDYAAQQGVMAVCFGAFEKADVRPPMDQLMDWLGQTEYIKTHYDSHLQGAKAFADLLKEADAEMLVMKGLSLTQYYPDPATREFGDLDVFSFNANPNPSTSSGQALDLNLSLESFKEAHQRVNKLVESKGVEVEYWDKHDVFNYAGTHVEHHSYFVSKNSKAGRRVNEFILESLAKNKGIKVAENVYYPTPDINAIFILHHTIGHMSYEGATLKNVLDYGLFLRKDGDKVNWDVVRPLMQETGWVVGFNTLVRVAEKVLAEDLSRFYIGTPNEPLVDKVLDTILDTTLHQEAGLPLLKRVFAKWQRLYSHKWMYTSGLIPANFWKDCVWGSLKEHIERPEQF